MKRIVWVVVALAAVAAVAFYYVRGGSSKEAAKYRTEAAESGDITMTVTATGTISAVTTVQVGSQVSGIIASLHADFNSRVRRGQLLAELDPTPFEARVEQRRADVLQAEVQMRRAKLDFDRQERLVRESLTSQADYDGAKATYEGTQAQVDQATAALRQAQTDLAYTRIMSPIDGVVVARQYDVGQTVAASFQAPTLFTIAQDLTKMQVQADVDQSDIGRISVGQPARFTVDAYPDEEFRASISQIRLNASVNQNVITYPAMLAVPNPEEKLRPQMTANVSIEVANVRNVLRVPNAALRFRPMDTGGADRRGATAAPRTALPSDGGTGPAERAKTEGEGGHDDRRGGGRSNGGQGKPGGHERREHAGDGAHGEARGGGFRRAAEALDAATNAPAAVGRPQAIYVLDAAGNPRRVPVRTGISDGRFTQIISGELSPGDLVIIGQATARVESTQLPPGTGGGGRMGGPGGRF